MFNYEIGENGKPICQKCNKEKYPLVGVAGKLVCGGCAMKFYNKQTEMCNKIWNDIET